MNYTPTCQGFRLGRNIFIRGKWNEIFCEENNFCYTKSSSEECYMNSTIRKDSNFFFIDA